MEAPKCGGKKRSGGFCRQPAGWGTEHVGSGKCKLHAGASTGPKDQTGNRNAVTHGIYETLMRERLPEEERIAFDQVPVETALEAELRVLRYKLLRLLDNVDQNLVVGFNIETIKADEFTKVNGIVQLADAIRKVVKEMKSGDDQGVGVALESFMAGVHTRENMQTEDLSE